MKSSEHEFFDSIKEEYDISESHYDNDERGEVFKFWANSKEDALEIYNRMLKVVGSRRIILDNLMIKIY